MVAVLWGSGLPGGRDGGAARADQQRLVVERVAGGLRAAAGLRGLGHAEGGRGPEWLVVAGHDLQGGA